MRHALKIVIIDDEKNLLASLDTLLSSFGHSISTSSSGEHGIALTHAVTPDVVICDIAMQGGINGYGVVRSLRLNQNFSKTFIVSLSGHSQQQDYEKSACAGFDRHIAKPVSLEKLLLLMDDAWRHKLRHTPRENSGRE